MNNGHIIGEFTDGCGIVRQCLVIRRVSKGRVLKIDYIREDKVVRGAFIPAHHFRPDETSQPKTRRHHNNTGYRQIRNGQPVKRAKRLARQLKVIFAT